MQKDYLQSHVIKSFSGNGYIGMGEEQYPCSFVAMQTVDGRVQFKCVMQVKDSFQCFSQETANHLRDVTFGGETDQQQSVLAKDIGSQRMMQRGAYCELLFHCGYLEITSKRLAQPVSMGSQLLNFEFLGPEYYVCSEANGGSSSGSRLPFKLGTQEFAIRTTQKYHDTVRHIKDVNGIGITAKIETALSSMSDMESAKQTIDDICILLSLARGCRVQATDYEVQDETGHILYFSSQGSPLKRYSLYPTIVGIHHVEPNAGVQTKRFIEAAFPCIQKAKEEWTIDKAIEYYNDAKRNGDEFEFSGLKMVVCMEFLRSQYLKHGDGDSILNSRRFSKIANDLIKPRLREVFQEAFANMAQEQTESILERLNELNRYSFKRTLLRMNQATGARISEQSVTAFVKIRNSLVHNGIYHPNYASAETQFHFLGEYIYRFMLSILGQPMDSVWVGYHWESDGAPIANSLKDEL